jgi:hypothetical protein
MAQTALLVLARITVEPAAQVAQAAQAPQVLAQSLAYTPADLPDIMPWVF